MELNPFAHGKDAILVKRDNSDMLISRREIRMITCSNINGIYRCNMTRDNNQTPCKFAAMKSSDYNRLTATRRTNSNNQKIASIEDHFELLRECYNEFLFTINEYLSMDVM